MVWILEGSAFRAELDFKKIVFSLFSEGSRRVVATERVESVKALPNGYTKLVVDNRRDVVVPTSREESLRLVVKLNEVIAEIAAVNERRRKEGLRAKAQQRQHKVDAALREIERRRRMRRRPGRL